MRTTAQDYAAARWAFFGGFGMGVLAIWQQSLVAAVLAGSLVIASAILWR